MATRTKKKQTEIPETAAPEQPNHPDLDLAALEYASARDARIAAGVTEKKKLDSLAAQLAKYEVRSYKFFDDDGHEFEVTKEVTKEKIKVKQIKHAGDGGDDDGSVDPE